MSDERTRILGLSMDPVADFRGAGLGKNAGLFAALDRRFGVVGVARPALPRLERYLHKLRWVHPDRQRWFTRAGFHPWVFRRRSAIVERELRRRAGHYDAIVQLGALFAPGLRPQRQPYVITMDNTYRLSERHYPAWVHHGDGRRRDEWLSLERMAYQHAAFLFPWSEFTRRSLIDDYGMPPEKVIAVGAGVHLSAPTLAGKRYDTRVALMVGDEFERKGGAVLLRAWARVREQLPDAELWIAGPPARHAGEHPGVRWLGYVADRAALAQIYSRAAVYVMPALFEPWGHAFLEAMGHGLPCVGSDRCAMPEIVAHGRRGLIVPAGQVEPLAEGLIALLGDPALAERLGRQAYADALRDYTWDAVVARMAPYLEQVAAQSRSGAAARGAYRANVM